VDKITKQWKTNNWKRWLRRKVSQTISSWSRKENMT